MPPPLPSPGVGREVMGASASEMDGPGAAAGALLLKIAGAHGDSPSHFTPGETEAQRGDMPCLRSPFW